jgi:acyl carrier protein
VTPVRGDVVHRGRHVELVALSAALYPVLHAELLRPGVVETWRTRGRYVPANEFDAFLGTGLHHALVARRPDGELVGLVESRDFEPIDGYCFVSAAEAVDHQGSGLIVEAVALFLDVLFSSFPVAKAYFLLSEDARLRIRSALGTLITEEAVLGGHVRLNGRRQDVTVGSVRRDEFEARLAVHPLARQADWRMVPPARRVPADALDRLAATLGRPLEALAPDARLTDVGLDSLGMLEVRIALEEAAGRALPDDLLAETETVGDLLGWVRSLT